ncbi:MAG: ATP-binding cassette domain-containing protein, partial [Thermoguttaceae bacterium]
MNNDESRTKDAEILASLRRRSAATPTAPSSEPRVPDETPNPGDPNSRAEALRRLRASNAPKERMSEVSPALRNLRRELIGEPATDPAPTADLEEDPALTPPPESIAVQAQDAEPDFDASPSPKRERRVSVSASPAAFPSSPNEAPRDPRPEIMVVSDLYKGYVMGKNVVPVLRGVNLTVHEGEFLAVVGQSGSGKSTLLHLLGTLDVPDAGSIYFDGQRIDNLPMGQRDSLRNHFIGMIFQFYHLLPEMTTLENVLTPLMIRDGVLKYLRRRSAYVREAKELLDLVGLSHRLRHRPNELSGGEMQRASIARALIAGPRLLL